MSEAKKEDTALDEFLSKFQYRDILNGLQMFSFHYAKKLPKVLIDGDELLIMVDMVKVEPYNVWLPIDVRSNKWLMSVNDVSTEMEKLSGLSMERWTKQNRIDLIGGARISNEMFKDVFFDYLKAHIDAWNKKDGPWNVCVSDRVIDIISSGESKKLLNNIRVIELSNEFKEANALF